MLGAFLALKVFRLAVSILRALAFVGMILEPLAIVLGFLLAYREWWLL